MNNGMVLWFLYDSRSVEHRAESPTSSCVSMKSDNSIGIPPHFSDQHGPAATQYVNPFIHYTHYGADSSSTLGPYYNHVLIIQTYLPIPTDSSDS